MEERSPSFYMVLFCAAKNILAFQISAIVSRWMLQGRARPNNKYWACSKLVIHVLIYVFSRIFGKPILLTILMKCASNCVCISVKDEWPAFPRTLGRAMMVSVCICACARTHVYLVFEGWRGVLIISSFWGRPVAQRTGPTLRNVIILSWAVLWSGCYFISTFCLGLNVNDALSAIYGRSSSLLQPYINIQHPSQPITHFRPGKIVTSFIGQILSQFPTAVCFHLWGSLSSSFHLSQHYSSGLPIKMIPIFITPENAESRLSRKKKPIFYMNKKQNKKKRLHTTYQKAGSASTKKNISKRETSWTIGTASQK